MQQISAWFNIALRILCAVCIAACCWHGMAQAAAAFVSVTSEAEQEKIYQDSIYYKITARNEVTITRSRASVTEAVIPSELDGCPVTAVQSYAFRNRTQLTKVILPETVTEIGDYAFYQCGKLTQVEIPAGVKKVGWGILNETPWLLQNPYDFVTVGDHILIKYTGTASSLVVPETVTAIAGHAFSGCTTLTEVTLPGHLTEIPAFAFDNCTSLRKIILPINLTAIGEYAFHWCTALESIAIPDGVITLKHHAFFGCSALQEVTLPKELSRLENAVFAGCRSLGSIMLPDCLERIGNQTFYECAALENIELPETVSYLGKSVFCNCTSLNKIVITNPECQIFDEDLTIFQKTVIYAKCDSTARTYALRYDRSFIALDSMLGDVDENGDIDLTDATLALTEYAQRAVREPSILTQKQANLADINRNGTVDLQDATLILTYYAESAVGNSISFDELLNNIK